MEIIFIVIIVSVLLALVISISWTNYKGSPWVPTSFKMVHKMLDLADLKPDELVYDLGSGDGRIAVIAARKYQARVVGIELNPLLWLWCQIIITILGLRSRVKVVLGNFYKQDLRSADVVACYLLPEAQKKLEDKLMRELRPGTRVVTNTFIFYQTRMAKRDGKARLYIFSPENTQVEFIKQQLIASVEKNKLIK
ncbi:MAG: class I SAM-dependent methyltransferase [Anaerolineales bacterium]|nr:class I SAM-dependent methyltransferase [Anaerolineales bacterium]